MQPRQMADSFFGFDTSLGAGLDEGLDCLEDEDFADENYDALNDETFGSEAIAGDWEQDHEKLAQITESSRPRFKNDLNKSDSEIDVEKSLSHLVLDEKEVTIPRPGVWDSPTNFPIAPIQPKPSLSATLKNACTVEELERGLISNRPPPGLVKPPDAQSQPPTTTSAGNLLLNSITSTDKLRQINGLSAFSQQTNPFSVVLPPNVRLNYPQLYLQQNARPPHNQPKNWFRLPLSNPLLMSPKNQRAPPFVGNFLLNKLPHPPNSSGGPFPFLIPKYPMMAPYNNHQSMPHHNMHMGNQRNQKQFNHNDRQDNHHQPFFRNNQYLQNQNHMRYYQNQGHHGNQHQHMNHHYNHMNGIGPSGEQDEYAGLMNSKEKEWLHNIQLLQLNTNQPYIDDYYYTVFCDRLNKKNENKDNSKNNNNNNKKSDNTKGGRNNSNGYRDSRDREQPQQHTFNKPANTPMQFENSLGKLQYSSVTAPRKIIDMDVVPNNDPQQTPSVQQKDMKKTRQLLLEIERLYILLLKLEDKNNPIAVLAEQQREQQQREQQQQQQDSSEPVPEPERKDPVKEKEELISSILTSLLQLIQEDKFASLLSIRKGKMLFLRFLSCIDVKENELKLAKLWVAVIKGLAIIGRRDSQLLINFYTEFIKCLNLSLVMNLSKEFVESTSQQSKNSSLTVALTNKLGISVISQMLKHVEEISQTNNSELASFDELWRKFLNAIYESVALKMPTVSPWDSLDNEFLYNHLQRYGITSSSQQNTFEFYFTDMNYARYS